MLRFEVVVLTEPGIPSFRTSNFQVVKNNKVFRQELNLIKERRDQAYIKSAAYKQRASSTSLGRSSHAVSKWET